MSLESFGGGARLRGGCHRLSHDIANALDALRDLLGTAALLLSDEGDLAGSFGRALSQPLALLGRHHGGRTRLTDVAHQALDVLHRGGHSLGEPPHFRRNQREAVPLLAGAVRLE